MSTFHSDHHDHALSRRMREYSAYLDGELGPASSKSVERAVADGTIPYDRAQAYRRIQRTLQTNDPAQAHRIDAARERVYARLEHSLAAGAEARPWWARSVRLPMPVAAASLTALVALSAVVVYLSGVVDSYPRGFADMAGGGHALNLQVHVDGEHTDELLRWLNQQEQLDQVMIRLPDSAEFQMFGAPVLMRSDLAATVPAYGGAVDGDSEVFSIMPLEDVEE